MIDRRVGTRDFRDLPKRVLRAFKGCAVG
jgi:hypothetical protein